MNCRLVKPVSKEKLAQIAVAMASRVMSMSSKKCRAPRVTQLFVNIASCAQSNWRSLFTYSCGKNSCICAWRISSSIPKTAMLRIPGAFDHRAKRASWNAAPYSTTATAA